MTNNEVRDYVKSKFGDNATFYRLLTREKLQLLKEYIRKEFSKILYEGKPEFKVRRKIQIVYKEGFVECAYLFTKGQYFEERECISFNRDGFIGFSGWASTENTKPVIDGFLKWLDKEF